MEHIWDRCQSSAFHLACWICLSLGCSHGPYWKGRANISTPILFMTAWIILFRWKKSQTATWDGVYKTLVNHGISSTFPSTGELGRFLNHQLYWNFLGNGFGGVGTHHTSWPADSLAPAFKDGKCAPSMMSSLAEGKVSKLRDIPTSTPCEM